MKQSRLDLLQQVYDFDQNHGGELFISLNNMDGTTLAALRADADYLIQNGYLRKGKPYMNTLSLAITEKGEQFVENGFKPPTASQSNFNFSGATIHNATIGNENTVGSMVYNSAAALSELESAIARRPSAEQADLNEMLDILRDIQRSQQPIEKSRLARFYELAKKSSDLILPIGKFLFEFVFAPRG